MILTLDDLPKREGVCADERAIVESASALTGGPAKHPHRTSHMPVSHDRPPPWMRPRDLSALGPLEVAQRYHNYMSSRLSACTTRQKWIVSCLESHAASAGTVLGNEDVNAFFARFKVDEEPAEFKVFVIWKYQEYVCMAEHEERAAQEAPQTADQFIRKFARDRANTASAYKATWRRQSVAPGASGASGETHKPRSNESKKQKVDQKRNWQRNWQRFRVLLSWHHATSRLKGALGLASGKRAQWRIAIDQKRFVERNLKNPKLKRFRVLADKADCTGHISGVTICDLYLIARARQATATARGHSRTRTRFLRVSKGLAATACLRLVEAFWGKIIERYTNWSNAALRFQSLARRAAHARNALRVQLFNERTLQERRVRRELKEYMHHTRTAEFLRCAKAPGAVSRPLSVLLTVTSVFRARGHGHARHLRNVFCLVSGREGQRRHGRRVFFVTTDTTYAELAKLVALYRRLRLNGQGEDVFGAWYAAEGESEGGAEDGDLDFTIERVNEGKVRVFCSNLRWARTGRPAVCTDDGPKTRALTLGELGLKPRMAFYELDATVC